MGQTSADIFTVIQTANGQATYIIHIYIHSCVYIYNW